MNIKDFLIDNYIYIIIVIVLIIITIIGFLADKKKSENKKDSAKKQVPTAGTEPMPINIPVQQPMNYQSANTVNQVNNPINNQMNNNPLSSNIGQIPLNDATTMQQPLGQVQNNSPFFSPVSEPNNFVNPVNINQNINNQGTISNDSNMSGINQGNGMQQNNTYTMPTPVPNSNLNNQMVTPLPTNPMTNVVPEPVTMTQAMPNNQVSNQNAFGNSATTPQPVNQMPIGFGYGSNQNGSNQLM